MGVTSSHGESRFRILRVARRGDRHDPRDLTLAVRFDQGVEAAGGMILPREALRSFVHRALRDHGDQGVEPLAMALCRDLLRTWPHIAHITVEIAEQPWIRTHVGGRAQGQAFVLGGPEQRVAVVSGSGAQLMVVAGIEHLMLMRTAGFLPPSTARAEDGTQDAVQALLVGSVSARWTYSDSHVAFDPYRAGVRNAIVETFAVHAERSVHHTLQTIANLILETYAEVADVTLAMRERPYPPAELFRPPEEGPDDLFVAADEPIALIEVTVGRGAM